MRNIFLASAAAATVLAGLGISVPASAQSGSFSRSCRSTQSANGVLTAECADAQGRYHFPRDRLAVGDYAVSIRAIRHCLRVIFQLPFRSHNGSS